MNAYNHARRLAKAIAASEAGRAYGADRELAVLSAERNEGIFGGRAPGLVWEGGPYEWASEFTGSEGERLGDSDGFGLPTDEATRAAVAALRADGFYLECSTGFALAVYVA